jgi:hypothetical protein
LESNKQKPPLTLKKQITATTIAAPTTTETNDHTKDSVIIANILYDDGNDNEFNIETFDYKRKSSFFNEITHDSNLNDPLSDKKANSIKIFKATDFFHVDLPFAQKSSSYGVLKIKQMWSLRLNLILTLLYIFY